MEEEIIQPIDRKLLKAELTPERQLRMTNKSHNEIYVVTAQNAPNVMKEIGRLREEAFRTAGGGTGKSMSSGILKTTRLSAATAISSGRTGRFNPTANLTSPQATCSTSPRSS